MRVTIDLSDEGLAALSDALAPHLLPALRRLLAQDVSRLMGDIDLATLMETDDATLIERCQDAVTRLKFDEVVTPPTDGGAQIKGAHIWRDA